jgi:membrane-associated phospholipid phosphatase
MGSIYVWGINLILFLQGLGDWLIPPMLFFTTLGVEEFYLLVTPVLYWCIDTTIGIRIAVMLMFSSSINNFGKWFFHEPRPYWVSPKVKAYAAETSFGLPSGHAQNSVTIWGLIAYSFKKRWIWVSALLLMFFIGISRLVLGVHFPQDALLGWTLGLVILLIFIRAEPPIRRWLRERTVIQKGALSFLVSIGMILFGGLILNQVQGFRMPEIWLENIRSAFPTVEVVEPIALSDQVSLGGAFFGLTLGYTILFNQSGFKTQGSWWQMILRYLVGVVGIVILWYGLDLVFPEGENFPAYAFRYLRYFLVGFWMTYLGPLVFMQLRLAESQRPSNPESAVDRD